MNKLTINDLRVGDLVKIRENSHYYDKDMKYKGFKVIKSINESLGAFKIENKSKGYLDYYYTPEMIAEVKRPCQYKTIYKREEPILDEEERKYLSTVIKPFRDNVKYISKRRAGAWFKYEYILICSKNEEDDLCFPNFPSQSMYKGMELERKYTIEELGL